MPALRPQKPLLRLGTILHNIEVIDNHSVAVDMLTGGPVLDAGCRGFRFAHWFSSRSHKVYAFDPSPDIEVPSYYGVNYYRMGVVGHSMPGNWELVECADKEASYLRRGEAKTYVPTADLHTIMLFCNIPMWDVIKLNVEGSEYDILDGLGPIARQIVVSFHEHTGRGKGRQECDRIISALEPYYEVVQHVWEPRYCTHANYWDTLLVAK